MAVLADTLANQYIGPALLFNACNIFSPLVNIPDSVPCVMNPPVCVRISHYSISFLLMCCVSVAPVVAWLS